MLQLNIKKQLGLKLVLAISGGVDSMCLLHLFLKEFDKESLSIVHINHNLRGEESDSDQQFVEAFASKHDIGFYSIKLNTPPKNEEEGRDKRYKFLEKILKKQNAKYIVTAQHKNDQIETLLLQLIRGTGSFSPMEEFSGSLWRPLLNIEKKEILSYAKQNNLKWKEDSTNAQNIFTRNILRNKIIPEINKINPNFGESLLRLGEISSKNSALIKDQAMQILHSNNIISKQTFENLNIAHKRGVLKSINPTLNFKNTEEICKMIKKGIGKKQKHGFILENGIIKNSKTNIENGKLKTENGRFLILASASPQRKRLMLNISENFIVIPSNYEEKWNSKKNTEENIKHFSMQKAINISKKHKGHIVIGCDTFVVHPKKGVYLKAKNEKEAKMQLESYSGEKIEILSGISVINSDNNQQTNIVKSYIQFDTFGKKEVKIWLSKNQWQERSGSFSVEGYTSNFINSIDGCFFNIIGLPVSMLRKMLINLI